MSETSYTGFAKMEDGFDKKFGSAGEKVCFGKLKTATACKIIAVLVVLDAFAKFMGTMQRWGAPCYHWQTRASTLTNRPLAAPLRACRSSHTAACSQTAPRS